MNLFRSSRSVHKKTFVPSLESLENRWVPSSVTVTGDSFQILNIDGDSGRDVVKIKNTDGNGTIVVTIDGNTNTYAGIRTINVKTLGNHDKVTYTQAKDLKKSVTLRAQLGEGDDTFTATVTGNVMSTNRSIKFEANGNGGNDRLETSVTGTMNGTLVQNLRGGDDDFNVFSNEEDTVIVRYTGVLGGVVDLTVNGGGGHDTLDVGLKLNEGSTGRIGGGDAISRMEGDTGSDRLIYVVDVVNDNDRISVTAVVNGGLLENDRGILSDNVPVREDLETVTSRNAI